MRFRYADWDAERHGTSRSTFDTLLDLFQQLLLHTGGDAGEALSWLTAIDKEYGLTDEGMGLGDFIEELKNQGYIDRDDETGVVSITAKAERGLRERSLEEIFKDLRKAGRGDHKTPFAGAGSERQPETRPYSFGDDVHDLDVTGTLSERLPPRRHRRVLAGAGRLPGVRDRPPHVGRDGPDDRPQPLDGPLRRGPDHAGPQDGARARRAHHDALPQGHARHRGVRERGVGGRDEGPARTSRSARSTPTPGRGWSARATSCGAARTGTSRSS